MQSQQLLKEKFQEYLQKLKAQKEKKPKSKKSTEKVISKKPKFASDDSLDIQAKSDIQTSLKAMHTHKLKSL
jgi:hypothetical protein